MGFSVKRGDRKVRGTGPLDSLEFVVATDHHRIPRITGFFLIKCGSSLSVFVVFPKGDGQFSFSHHAARLHFPFLF